MNIRTRVELYNIEETFTRPILVSLVKDIKNMVGIHPDTFTVLDVKDALIKEKKEDGEVEGYNTLKSEMVIVDYEENMIENEELKLDSMYDKDLAIFRDPDIDCTIRPLFHNRKINLKLSIRTKFKNRAYGMINKLKMMPANQEMYTYHVLEYGYILPVHVNRWLKMIYELKTKREQDKIDLEPWLASHFDDRLIYFNRADGGKKSRLGIRETQVRVPGYITSDLFNIKPDYDEEEKSWVIELEYEAILEKPVAVILEYPIIIWNTIIPKAFRNFIVPYKEPPRANFHAQHENTDVMNTRPLYTIHDDRDYLCIPEQDKPYIPENTGRKNMLSVLCQLDETKPTVLFNIQELGKIRFKECFLNFILDSEWKYIHEDNKSIIHMKLYENNKPKYDKIRMDEYGNVYSLEPLDYKKTYRVVFSLNTYLNGLDMVAYNRINKYMVKDLQDLKPERILEGNVVTFLYFSIFDIRLDIVDLERPMFYLRDTIKNYPVEHRLWDKYRVMNFFAPVVERMSSIDSDKTNEVRS